MSISTVKNKPAAPVKSALPMPSAHPASAQAAAAAAAFAAHLKKNQAEQLSRSMRHARRDSVGRLLAAEESAPGIAQLLSAGDEAVNGVSQRQQDQQDHSEAQQQDQREGERDCEQKPQQEYQPGDPQNASHEYRYEARTRLLGQHIIAMDARNDAITDALVERLAPVAANDGLFDVVHPDGTVLSVAVTHTPERLSLLLSTTSERDNKQLRDCKMELEQRLGRRIGKDVVIALL